MDRVAERPRSDMPNQRLQMLKVEALRHCLYRLVGLRFIASKIATSASDSPVRLHHRASLDDRTLRSVHACSQCRQMGSRKDRITTTLLTVKHARWAEAHN